jgi:hypothetical protein
LIVLMNNARPAILTDRSSLTHASMAEASVQVHRSARLTGSLPPDPRTHCSKRPVCFDHVRRPCGQATALVRPSYPGIG